MEVDRIYMEKGKGKEKGKSIKEEKERRLDFGWGFLRGKGRGRGFKDKGKDKGKQKGKKGKSKGRTKERTRAKESLGRISAVSVYNMAIGQGDCLNKMRVNQSRFHNKLNSPVKEDKLDQCFQLHFLTSLRRLR